MAIRLPPRSPPNLETTFGPSEPRLYLLLRWRAFVIGVKFLQTKSEMIQIVFVYLFYVPNEFRGYIENCAVLSIFNRDRHSRRNGESCLIAC